LACHPSFKICALLTSPPQLPVSHSAFLGGFRNISSPFDLLLCNVILCLRLQCVFEKIKDEIYERTAKSSLPIVDALFSEMTVLGFLSMVTFIVSSAGFINDISAKVYGDTAEGKEFLKELFEKVRAVATNCQDNLHST
jgi:hypothetical protein